MSICATPSCGKVLGQRNTSGLCQPCVTRARNHCPDFRAKASASLRARFANDEDLRRRRAISNAEIARRPENREANRQRMMGNTFGHRSNINRPAGSQARAIAGKRVSATKLAHIPSDFRDSYRELRKLGLPAAEAETIVLEHAARALHKIRTELGEGA